MNSETKRHIDAARQVLVGVVPNPASQIDQITYALIYKFMDDMDQSAIKNGDEPNFFIDDLEDYSWSRLMDTKIGNQERMNLYVVAFQKFAEAKQLPELFRNILKSAFLPYRSPETLGLFLKEIDYFDYSHPEELGNAYEYLLSIMSSQGDAGQFRTPRHIIDFIVDVVNPKKEDKVLDPACGTGGFLVSSYKHILEQHDGKNDPDKKEKSLTPDQRRNLMNNFEGYDIDPTMVRIAQVNMYLHQFKKPKIFQYDSLSSDERWNDKFDVILANPPFMSPKGGIKPHNKFSIQSSRSEVLFVDYIMNHLRPNGRAGIIVPEGIIFQSGGAHKQLRKNMIEDGLYAVVSLPSGVFNPYSGVKTSILFFNNEIAKKANHILFVKISNDGFDLGAQRRLNINNDLPLAVEAINKYQKHVKENGKLSIGGWPEEGENIDTYPNLQFVSKGEISKDGEYNLSGDRYRIIPSYSHTKWSMVNIGDIAEFIDDGDWIESKDQSSSGIRLIQTGNVGIGNYIDKIGKERYISEETFKKLKCTEVYYGDVLLSRLPDPVGRACILPKLNVRTITSVDCTIFRFKNLITAKYFVLLTLSKRYQEDINSKLSGATRQRISKGNLLKIQIPFPPLEIQEQIVNELGGYRDIISGAKQVIKSWKPRIDIDQKWKKLKLGEVCKFVRGPFGGSLKKEIFVNDGYAVYEQSHAIYSDFSEFRYFIDDIKFNEMKRFEVKSGDLIMSCSGTMGKTAIIPINTKKGIINQALLKLTTNEQLDVKFLKMWMDSSDFQVQLLSQVTGVAIQNVASVKVLQDLIIPIPSLEIQKEIVAKVEVERDLVESAKKLIDIYEQKTKDTIDKLWEQQ